MPQESSLSYHFRILHSISRCASQRDDERSAHDENRRIIKGDLLSCGFFNSHVVLRFLRARRKRACFAHQRLPLCATRRIDNSG